MCLMLPHSHDNTLPVVAALVVVLLTY